MKLTLNLAYPELSDILFTKQSFPDGQQQVVINSFSLSASEVVIKSRLNNFIDLELIVCAVKSLYQYDVPISLFVPYFLGSRSDRKFEVGSNNYLKDVICPIINSLGLKSVTVIDPHSDILEACLSRFDKSDNYSLAKFALSTIDNKNGAHDRIIFISPDAGANKKIFSLAEKLKYSGPIITCDKSRDTNGNISKVRVPMGELSDSDKNAVIIDDICDGGRTFINIAKEMKDNGFKGNIYLIVTHGIFSAGFTVLNTYFDGIFYTNSYSDYVLETEATSKIKQLNVF